MTAPRPRTLLVPALAAVWALAACGTTATTQVAQAPAATAPTAAAGITYTITATVPTATITYVENAAGSVKTITANSFPWTKTIDVPDTFPSLALLGSTGKANGSITCTITDSTGRVIKTASASGVVAVASCDGSKP